jgi:malate dehydrogenase (oxaloacetate-decarboxylating)
MLGDGLTDAEARRRFFIVDKTGLLTEHRRDLSTEQRVHAQPGDVAVNWSRTSNGPPSLADVVANTASTILMRLSTAARSAR